jgi:hypothetical protein
VENTMNPEKCKIYGFVRAKSGGSVIRNAEVRIVQQKEHDDKREHKTRTTEPIATGRTNAEGRYAVEFTPEEGSAYRVECTAFGHTDQRSLEFTPKRGEIHNQDIEFKALEFTITLKSYDEHGKPVEFHSGKAGRSFLARLEPSDAKIKDYRWSASHGAIITAQKARNEIDVSPQHGGEHNIKVTIADADGALLQVEHLEFFAQADVQMVGGKVNLRLERTATPPTLDEAFWSAIRDRTDAISFGPYSEFIDHVMKGGYDFHAQLGNTELDPKLKNMGTVRHGVQAYELLKVATQVFLLLQCGVRIGADRDDRRVPFDSMAFKLDEYLGHSGQLPYIRRVIDTAFPWLKRDGLRCDCVLAAAHEPCLIELIKEYFLEEGMLMQAMNAITMRFQNVHAPGERDPLAHLEIDPLRPLGNILWGRTQDLHLLSVKRRAYEYMHQYGLALYGKATASLRPADNRSKFLEGFNNLMYLCSVFFKEDNDTTVIADGYPLLNALKEVHLVLAQGAHNQFGDLPWTARAETLVQEWIMAQPEIREFLQSRAMVPYKEPWMPQVDTMKTLQGWSDVTVTSFRDLGVYGERIVLSVRFGNWIAYVDENHAKNWARFFRADIQAYLHAYRAVTGVDLTNPDTVDATMPSVHLQKRLSVQHGAR